VAKFVKINFRIGISGTIAEAGAKMHIDDNDYKNLSHMYRMGVPYVELLEEEVKDQLVVEKAKVETATKSEPETSEPAVKAKKTRKTKKQK
jgi:hypothetical protein